MKRGFYLKLGFEGIRKNKQLYTPYLLTCTLMVLMSYMITALSENPYIEGLKGGRTTQAVMQFGGIVMVVFSALFLFYTNSFMTRRRHKEFGLYNVLGMSKRHIGRILLWESILSGLFSLGVGLVSGVLFSKLFEMGLVFLLKEPANYALNVSVTGVTGTVLYFGIIFGLLFIRSLFTLGKLKPTELIKAENVGEKPPKANWVLAVLGLLVLGVAYYMAINAPDPVTAMALFFVAVILVIIATYLLFISGSVAFCRMLQKNKGYYYKSNHFISVGSMIYRMKRNGAGLGSICVLITMVLVMLSSTTCLYFGAEKSLDARFPLEHILSVGYRGETDENRADAQEKALLGLRDVAVKAMAKKGIRPTKEQMTQLWVGYAAIVDNSMQWMRESGLVDVSDSSQISQLSVISLKDYNAATGKNLSLQPGQLYLYTNGSFKGDSLLAPNGERYQVLPLEDSFNNTIALPLVVTRGMELTAVTNMVVEDIYDNGFADDRELSINYWGMYAFDVSQTKAYLWDIMDAGSYNVGMERLVYENPIIRNSFDSSREAESVDFYATFGGLLFLGVSLSIVFIAAAVLMMYFKQLCEGYEDQRRFAIMQNVGMRRRDIRKTVNSQLLTVFFAPLIMAGVHLCFAFPMIEKILYCFGLSNGVLFLQTTLVSLGTFALFYVGIYMLSSKTYTRIVTGGGDSL